MRYVTTIGQQDFEIEIVDENHIILDGNEYEIDFDSIGEQPVFSLLIDGQSFEAFVYPAENTWQVLLRGRSYPALVVDEREKLLRAASGSTVGESTEFHLRAPMPGQVIAVPIAEGDDVQEGVVLVILESMKMQNELKSPRAGTVARLRIKEGDNVEQNETMLSVV